ncbi:Ldh family oxidoreductase [Erwinia endophytica]|uniref:Ldh family oxidoreductase n=1 Tax=Erwinia endophytica TaxID=1563158 RepID=UPI001265F2BD|nr:Ldh family oxidoreductase [Erwinia endophytica]KAB8305233.1 Ldh family oxidoreductase [Erwinia endophytica]
MMPANSKRFTLCSLERFSLALLMRAGVPEERALPMTQRMLDADLLGHSTHGLWFMSAYLERIAAGQISPQAELQVIHDQPNAFAWHAHRAPGAWVMHIATEELLRRVGSHGVVSATIADCSHIGCLQTYLLPLVEKNLLVTLCATNPGVRSVAPFGGSDSVLTTNPVAWGIPTRGAPILIDQCTSVASNTFFKSFAAKKHMLPEAWLLDSTGQPTHDPAVLQHTPPGSILPLGGLQLGYKGFGLGLMVEAFSLALGGSGRRQEPDMYGQGVFIQVIDPDCFAGREAFLDEMDYLVASCKASRLRPDSKEIRLPGERALAEREQQWVQGITLNEEVLSRLHPWTEHFDLPFPESLPH